MDLREIGGHELDSTGSGLGPMAGCSEYSNEPPGFIKGETFIA
jgi:hypothetical protein